MLSSSISKVNLSNGTVWDEREIHMICVCVMCLYCACASGTVYFIVGVGWRLGLSRGSLLVVGGGRSDRGEVFVDDVIF